MVLLDPTLWETLAPTPAGETVVLDRTTGEALILVEVRPSMKRSYARWQMEPGPVSNIASPGIKCIQARYQTKLSPVSNGAYWVK